MLYIIYFQNKPILYVKFRKLGNNGLFFYIFHLKFELIGAEDETFIFYSSLRSTYRFRRSL